MARSRGLASGAAALLLATSAPTSAGASAAPRRYGETLIAAEMARHPELRGMVITAPIKDGSIAVIGDPSTRGAFSVPLANAMGEPVGIVTIQLRDRTLDAGLKVHMIANELARAIYVADNLDEPDPFVAGAVRAPAAQRMVDAAMAADPRLVTLAMHVTLPGIGENRIIASNFGRIGKAGDKDDQHVIDSAKPIRELTDGGQRLAIELPMKDREGHVIGALSTSYSIGCGLSANDAFARAVHLRDNLASRTPSLAALAQP